MNKLAPTENSPQHHKQKHRSRIIRLCRIWLKETLIFSKKENIPRLALITLVIIVSSSLLIYWLEEDISLLDSFWWSLVTLTTVGYGDVIPVTLAGRLLAAVDMLLGVSVLAILTAKIASTLVAQRHREDLGMKDCTCVHHMIICEWNYRTHDILKDLRKNHSTHKLPVVLIADIPHKPVDDDYLYFVRGQVSDETLVQANLKAADTVLILGDDKLEDANRDAKVVLATLTVESINPYVYTIVELVNQAYVPTCRRAKADEIIVGSKISSRLMLTAALTRNTNQVFTDLLFHEHGNQVTTIAASPSEVGQHFVDLLGKIKRDQQSLLIGIQQGQTGEIISNPPADYQIQPEDLLILIRPIEMTS